MLLFKRYTGENTSFLKTLYDTIVSPYMQSGELEQEKIGMSFKRRIPNWEYAIISENIIQFFIIDEKFNPGIGVASINLDTMEAMCTIFEEEIDWEEYKNTSKEFDEKQISFLELVVNNRIRNRAVNFNELMKQNKYMSNMYAIPVEKKYLLNTFVENIQGEEDGYYQLPMEPILEMLVM